MDKSALYVSPLFVEKSNGVDSMEILCVQKVGSKDPRETELSALAISLETSWGCEMTFPSTCRVGACDLGLLPENLFIVFQILAMGVLSVMVET